MTTTTYHLALDCGAESGRVMLGTLSDGKLALEELHRFPTGAIRIAGSMRWDVLRIADELRQGVKIAAARGLPIASLSTDTWGVEVRPNETKDVNQPWHWVVIPAMGLYMGEMFNLAELAEDCAKDKVYEFFFCGPPLVIPGATGSPINPQAIK